MIYNIQDLVKFLNKNSFIVIIKKDGDFINFRKDNIKGAYHIINKLTHPNINGKIAIAYNHVKSYNDYTIIINKLPCSKDELEMKLTTFMKGNNDVR